MTPRTLLRLVLVTFGAVALGVLGAVALGAGTAGATTAPALGPGLAPSPPGASGAGPSLGLGPIAVELPAAPAPGEAVQLTVPVPRPAAPTELPGLPLISATLAIPVPTGPDLASVPPPAPRGPAAPHAASVPTDVPAPRGARSPTPTPTSTPTHAPSEAVATDGAPGAPSVPLTPWTLALAGAVLVSAATDGHRPGDASSFVAVVNAARRVIARLVGSLTLPRSGASRPGFALLLARPG